MSDRVRRRPVDSRYISYAKPHTFNPYDLGSRASDVGESLPLSPQTLRRRGAPVPAPEVPLSDRSTPSTQRSTSVKTSYKSAHSNTMSSVESVPCTNSPGSRDACTPSLSQDDQAAQLNTTQRPLPTSASAVGISAPVMTDIRKHYVARVSRQNEPQQRDPALQGGQSPATQVTPLPVPERSKEGSASAAPPRVPIFLGPEPSALTAMAPMNLRKTHPTAFSLYSVSSSIGGADGPNGCVDQTKNPAQPTSNSAPRSRTMKDNIPPSPLYRRQQAQALGPTGDPPMIRESSTTVPKSAHEMADRPAVSVPAPSKADKHLVAPKELRRQRRQGEIPGPGYVAQTAYTQRNPFRIQDFAEFAGNPQYLPPPGFHLYPQAMATRVYGFEVSRTSQQDFMMQRLLDAAHPSTAEERAEIEVLMSETFEKLQLGDWFYKWTRINHVHQRFVWLNLQRGTLMWSLSSKKRAVFSSEVKLSTITSVTPECLELKAPVRFFYRMSITTPERCICLATEIRKKFDVWYHVLQHLTVPNLTYGLPSVWGRPSGSINAAGWGAGSRWASRYSPLVAMVDHATAPTGYNEVYEHGAVSSSD
ncbi:hypothetical protein, conserved [Leishmania tarentolae]|uniref:Pleckstrin homology domain-containing protein n=1 Tax=Leishmania tarentolae TaxID=5689 RepID=A0A640KK83_LEITA|nr:hypothetical protein, conserved [Leishmania tarentolae]